MATHGYGGISRWIHGSVAERVLQTATVPILLIRARQELPDVVHKPAQCRRILVPLDASALAEQVLPPVTAVAKALCAESILFRVLTLFTSVSLTGEWHMPLENVVEIARQDAQQYLARVAEDLQAQGIAVSIDFQIGAGRQRNHRLRRHEFDRFDSDVHARPDRPGALGIGQCS